MRFETPRKHIPICIASLNKKSVEFTAQKADGWLPVMIPINSLKKAIADFREIATAAGRDPSAVAVKAPGHVTVTNNVDRAKAGHAANVAFYAARMGTFYSEQLTRFGFGDDVQKVKQAWDAGGSKAGTEAVSPKLLDGVRLYRRHRGRGRATQGAGRSGRRLHPVDIDAGTPAEFEKTCGCEARFERSLQTRSSPTRSAKALYRNRDRGIVQGGSGNMKAAVFEATKKPLVVKNVPDPECAPNGAIIRVEANGICRSDWHAWSGDWTWMGLAAQPGAILGP